MVFEGGGGHVSIDCPYNVATTNISGPTVSFNNVATTINGSMSDGKLSGTGDFTITSSFAWTSGAMSGSGTTIVAAGAQLNIAGDNALSLGLNLTPDEHGHNRTLDNQGQITWSGLGGGLMEGAGTIDNYGTFTKNDGSTVALNVVFNNYSTVAVQAGTLQLGGGGAADSTFTINQNATLEFTAGAYTIDDDITTTGTVIFSGATVTDYAALSAGTLSVSDGSVSFTAAAVTSAGVLSGGVLGGSATFTINGQYDWTGGTLQVGTTTVSPGAALTIEDLASGPDPSLTMGFGAVLNNRGTIHTLEYSGIRLTNTPDSATINNSGTFSVEGQSMMVDVGFNNTGGTVLVQSGVLILSHGGQSTGGTFRLADNASLTFGGPAANYSYSINAASSITLASNTLAPDSTRGVLFFSGGFNTVACPLNLYQIVVDGGQTLLNANATLSELGLSGGILSGTGSLTVTGNMNWIGGTMTGSVYAYPNTTIAAGADLFIFEYGLQKASYRKINIAANANAYLYENAKVDFQGGVTLTNAGTFTAFDNTSITGTITDAFNNTGTFTIGGTNGNGSVALGLPFNNSAQVNIVAGTLFLQSGTSTGTWSISDTASLTFAGKGKGTAAQVYVFNTGSSITPYPLPIRGPWPRLHRLRLARSSSRARKMAGCACKRTSRSRNWNFAAAISAATATSRLRGRCFGTVARWTLPGRQTPTTPTPSAPSPLRIARLFS